MFFSNCSLDTVLSCGLSTNQHNGFPLPFFLCLRSSFRKSQPGSLAQTVIENIAHDKFLAFSGSTFVVRRRAFWHLSASDSLKCSRPVSAVLTLYGTEYLLVRIRLPRLFRLC